MRSDCRSQYRLVHVISYPDSHNKGQNTTDQERLLLLEEVDAVLADRVVQVGDHLLLAAADRQDRVGGRVSDPLLRRLQLQLAPETHEASGYVDQCYVWVFRPASFRSRSAG